MPKGSCRGNSLIQQDGGSDIPLLDRENRGIFASAVRKLDTSCSVVSDALLLQPCAGNVWIRAHSCVFNCFIVAIIIQYLCTYTIYLFFYFLHMQNYHRSES